MSTTGFEVRSTITSLEIVWLDSLRGWMSASELNSRRHAAFVRAVETAARLILRAVEPGNGSVVFDLLRRRNRMRVCMYIHTYILGAGTAATKTQWKRTGTPGTALSGFQSSNLLVLICGNVSCHKAVWRQKWGRQQLRPRKVVVGKWKHTKRAISLPFLASKPNDLRPSDRSGDPVSSSVYRNACDHRLVYGLAAKGSRVL